MTSQPQPLRVMLVSADPDVTDVMRAAMANAPDFEVVAEAWPGLDASRRAEQLTPDAVLLHVEEPIVAAERTVELIGRSFHGGLAVVTGVQGVDAMRRLMNAGAHDVATLPLGDDGIRDSIHRAVRASVRRSGEGTPQTDAAAGRVITVAGPRGGVGKTTFATNLAVDLAKRANTAVALVDLDTMFGTAALSLDIIARSTIADWMRERSAYPNAPVARHLSEHHSGVRVLAVPPTADGTPDIGPADVADLVSDLAGTHEYIVIDTAAGFSPVTAAALDLSTFAFLVTCPELPALHATREVLSTLKAWGQDQERVRVVMNHRAQGLRISAEDAEQALGWPVAWELPYDRALLRSVELNQSLADVRPRAEYLQRLGSVTSHVAGLAEVAPRRRLLKVI